MRTWIHPSPIEVSDEFREAVGGRTFIAEALSRRGITTPKAARSFLDPNEYRPAPASELPGIEAATKRLLEAAERGEMICVWGDFDVDGQTATTVLVSVLKDLGCQVTYYIPNRARESHGVHLASLKRILDDGAKVVLTCDTGISAHEAANYARSRNIDFIITDHHELPDQLPNAYAIINPRLLPGDHPLSTLPGVGVAYKMAEYLYERIEKPGEADRLLDLVALGIVADVATLTGDTRYLLQRGISVIRRSERLGLTTLMKVAELNQENITAEHIGYVIGPRLNSIGRLGDANSIVELLTTQENQRAHILALELEGVNAQRQLLTSQVFQAATAQIERDPSLVDSSVLVLAHPDWPAGILGIVANRLVEQYSRPTILINAEKDGLGRGSARSVPGVNITQAIAEVASQSNLITGFGGHAMAAGLSLQADVIPEFRTAISRTVNTLFGEARPESSLTIDAQIKLSDIGLDLVDDIERLSPFGPGNPPIILSALQLSIENKRKVGRNQEHLLLVVRDKDDNSQKVMWWQGADRQLPEGFFDLAFTLQSSDYQGQPEVQVQWVDARSTEEEAGASETKQQELNILDFRTTPFPVAIIEQWKAPGSVIVWCEDDTKEQISGRNRTELFPAQTFIIWSIPPGRSELLAAVARVKPETVILLGVNPGMDKPERFLHQLAGLVKYALNQLDGLTSLSQLAAATAQRASVVLIGLDWLSASGKLTFNKEGVDQVRFTTNLFPRPGDVLAIESRLRSALQETAAYRAYYLRTSKEQLL